MNTVTVNASKTYDVRICQGLIKNIGKSVKEILSPEKCVIVTDDNVNTLYADTAEASLKDEGIVTYRFVFPHGEQSKCPSVYIELINFLADCGLSRTDSVIALGGGVTGDLAGFAAATYLRGIGLVQIPTTLLAMVDSSVGGKTAIDLPMGKNLCGAFYQPDLVLCDTETLKTLPDEFFLDGCAEIIKYGLLGDAALLAHLEEKGIEFDAGYVIPTCVKLKRDIVSGDEFDRGVRQLLNLGHTAGHVIEKLSNFAVSHGRAVAMGLAIVAESAAMGGYCSDDYRGRIINLLKKFGFSLNHGFNTEDFLPAFETDKKRSGSTLTAVIPIAAGESRLCKMSVSDFRQFITTGVEKWK